MAEFCLDCWNKINETCDKKGKYILSKDLDLCEGCGKWKPIIIAKGKISLPFIFKFFTLLIGTICESIYCIWKLLFSKKPIVKNKKTFRL